MRISSSVSQFSGSHVYNTLRPHGLQHTGLFCPSPIPGECQSHVKSFSDSIQPPHPLLFASPPAFKLSQHQDLSQWVSSLYRWPRSWSFSFSICPSNEHPGLISLMIDYFDFLAIQGTLKSLLQHHSSKASILQHSAFFIVQLSHSYMTTGKTIALIKWIFVSKVMSVLFTMLSRLVIAFLPRSKCLLIMAAVIICSDFGAQENSLSLFPLFPHLFAVKWQDQMPWS